MRATRRTCTSSALSPHSPKNIRRDSHRRESRRFAFHSPRPFLLWQASLRAERERGPGVRLSVSSQTSKRREYVKKKKTRQEITINAKKEQRSDMDGSQTTEKLFPRRGNKYSPTLLTLYIRARGLAVTGKRPCCLKQEALLPKARDLAVTGKRPRAQACMLIMVRRS